MLGATHHTIAASLSSPLLFRNFRVSCAVRSCKRDTWLHGTAWRPRAPPGRCPRCLSTCPPSPPCPPRARRRSCPGAADTPPSPAPPPRRSEPAPSKYFSCVHQIFWPPLRRSPGRWWSSCRRRWSRHRPRSCRSPRPRHLWGHKPLEQQSGIRCPCIRASNQGPHVGS